MYDEKQRRFCNPLQYNVPRTVFFRDTWVPVTIAWRVLRLRMEELPPGMESSSEYIEYAVANSQQGAVLHLEIERGDKKSSR
jgi:hypothetical protein